MGAQRTRADGSLEGTDEIERLAWCLRGLGHPGRVTILELLSGCELCVGEIARQLRKSQPYTSNHLAFLRSCALVRTRRDHRRVYYRLADERVVEMIALVRSLAREGPRLRVVAFDAVRPARWSSADRAAPRDRGDRGASAIGPPGVRA